MIIISSPERAAFESICYKHETQDQLKFSWQSNRDFTIVIILQGQGRRFIGDSMNDFKAGDFVLIPPGMPFAYVNDYEYVSGGAEYIWLRFNSEFAGKDFFSIPEMSHCSGLLKRSDRGLQISDVSQSIISIISEMEEMNRLNRMLTFLTILDSLAGLPVEVLATEDYKAHNSRDDIDRIQVVCRYMNSNYQKNISAEKLGSLIHMSPPSFCRFFKRVMNKTFHKYLCEIRIALAKRLLSNTEMITEDVGKRCGFRTIPGFTARFKDLTEQTPAAFRRQARVK
jgi:AraC-like DNA-binding protein